MRKFLSMGIAAGLIVAATSCLAPTPSEARSRVRVNVGTNYAYPYGYGYGSAYVNPSDPHSWYFWAQPSGPSAAAPYYPYANYAYPYGNYYYPTGGGLIDSILNTIF